MKKRLTIKYDGFHEEMEEELGVALERYGWHRGASGHNLETGVRDIAYEKESYEFRGDISFWRENLTNSTGHHP